MAQTIQEKRSDKIRFLFQNLNKNSMDLVDDFYRQEALFIDPLGRHQGLQSIRQYYETLYQNVTSIRFEFGDEIVQEGKHSLPWVMFLAASGLNSGQEIRVEGLSVFDFESNQLKVHYQRDYFDMGAFIYEQIPLLKNLISWIKDRLKKK